MTNVSTTAVSGVIDQRFIAPSIDSLSPVRRSNTGESASQDIARADASYR
jgi:hypothetical protein